MYDEPAEPVEMKALFVTQLRRHMFNLKLHVKPKLHNVSIAHHVVLSFHAYSAVSAGFSNAAVLDQIIITHDLRLDKTPLKVSVDDARRLGRRRPGTAG